MFGIEWWFCCLHPRERGVLRSTAEALVLTLFLGVPEDVWQAFWVVYEDNGEEVRQAFLRIYGLEIVSITVDEELVSVVRPASGFLALWVSYSLYILTPGAACLAGCEQSTVP